VGDKPWLTWPLLIIIILLCFYFLSTTGNDYLAETLGIISDKMKLSQNLAGLTLLALGNTAPDVAVAIVSGDDDDDAEGGDQGLVNSLSSVLGGGSMVFGFVLSSVVFFGKNVKVSGFSFIRDLLAYLIIVSFVLIIGLTYKKMNLFIAFVILGLYVAYVVISVLTESLSKDKDEDLEIGINNDNNSDSDDEDLSNSQRFKVELLDDKSEKKGGNINIQNQIIINHNEDNKEEKQDKDNNIIDIEKNNKEKNDNIEGDGEKKLINNEIGLRGFGAINLIKEKEGKKKFSLSEIMDATYYGKVFTENEKAYKSYSTELAKKNSNKYNYAIMRYYYLTKNTQWSEKSLFEKIIYVSIDFTFDLVRNLSIPPFEKKRYNKSIFICLPITIPLTITVFFPDSMFKLYKQSPYCWITLAYYILAIIFAIVLNFTTYRTNMPNCQWVLLLSALVMSILWVMAASNILVQMIKDAQLLLPFPINQSFLAMTILAVGNSVPDFIVNCSLAKSGYAEMALSGCVGAPIFGMTIGFGSSMIIKFIGSKEATRTEVFDLTDKSKISFVVLCAMTGIILNLIQNMLTGFIQKFTIKRYNSFVGFSIFFLYIIGISIVTFCFN
jgi:sodium/potassium/calcium exchanger 6